MSKPRPFVVASTVGAARFNKAWKTCFPKTFIHFSMWAHAPFACLWSDWVTVTGSCSAPSPVCRIKTEEFCEVPFPRAQHAILPGFLFTLSLSCWRPNRGAVKTLNVCTVKPSSYICVFTQPHLWEGGTAENDYKTVHIANPTKIGCRKRSRLLWTSHKDKLQTPSPTTN